MPVHPLNRAMRLLRLRAPSIRAKGRSLSPLRILSSMKTLIFNYKTYAVVAALALPLWARAAEPQTSLTGESTRLSGSATGSAASSAEAASQKPVAGVVVRDGSAYIVSKLQYEMSMPDGRKIEPNGTVKEPDGSIQKVDPNQMLTFDGQVAKAPFAPASSGGLPPNRAENPAGSTSNAFSAGHLSLQPPGEAFHQEPQTGIDSGKLDVPPPGQPKDDARNIPEKAPDETPDFQD